MGAPNTKAIPREMQILCDLLKEWAGWQEYYNIKIGYPTRSIGLESGYVSKDFEELEESADSETMKLVNAAFDSLAPSQQAAICVCYKLAAVFRFPRNNYAQVLADAHDNMLRLLLSRADWIFV